MRALVTGGAGFVGSNLVDALAARGDDVVVLDDLSTGRRENLSGALDAGVALEVADVRDAAQVDRVVAAARPDVVFHLAAQVDVRRSVQDPAADAHVNLIGAVHVMEAARRAGVRRLVNTSTGGAIYGEVDPGTLPVDETCPSRPATPYGLSKLAAERYLEQARELHGFDAVTLRYGNVYGPRQDPAGDAGVVAIFCGCAIRGERPVIFGDGLQTRDYVYVDDVVDANLVAADAPRAAGAYNVGTQTESTVLDLVDALRVHLTEEESARFVPRYEAPRLGEVRRSCLDAGRARAELGVRARTPLAAGIGRTLAAAREALALR